MKKYIAELIGTFFLVFIGTGTVAFSGTENVVAVGLAFGLAITMMAYTIGSISGAHLNPAVSIAMYINKRLELTDLLGYIVSQVIGAILASAIIKFFVDQAGLDSSQLGQNGFSEISALTALLAEIIFSFLFIFIILMVTSKWGNEQFAGLVIGLALAILIMVGLNLTGVSVNPARSIGPALFAGGDALSQLWVFIVAPIIGGILAAICSQFVFESEKD